MKFIAVLALVIASASADDDFFAGEVERAQSLRSFTSQIREFSETIADVLVEVQDGAHNNQTIHEILSAIRAKGDDDDRDGDNDSCFSGITNCILVELEGLESIGDHLPPCNIMKHFASKIKSCGNTYLNMCLNDKLADAYDATGDRLEPIQCEFQIQELETNHWPCDKWYMEVSENKGNFGLGYRADTDGNHRIIKDFAKATITMMVDLVNKFDTHYETADCLGHHKSLRLEPLKRTPEGGRPKNGVTWVDDDVPGCAFKFGSSPRFSLDENEDFKVEHAVRAWKLPCANGIRAAQIESLKPNQEARGQCCDPRCGYWQWRENNQHEQEFVHACDQRTCIERTPGGFAAKVEWELNCCPDAIALRGRACEDATDVGCVFPHDPDATKSYANYPGSGEVPPTADDTGADAMHFVAEYDGSMDREHLHQGYIGALKLLGESFPDMSDPICNERAKYRLLRHDDPYSCDYSKRKHAIARRHGPITVYFPSSSGDSQTYVQVYCGDSVPYSYAHYGGMPQIYLPGANPDGFNHYYTVVILDPDTPYPTEYWSEDHGDREVVHYLVGNIMGSDLILGTVSNGDMLAPTTGHDWMPPSPAKDSDRHRYVVLIYDQGVQNKIQFNTTDIGDPTKGGFNILEFAEKYGFDEPVASHYWTTQFSCSEPGEQCGGGLTDEIRAEGPGCCKPHWAYWDHDQQVGAHGQLKFQKPYNCTKHSDYYYQCENAQVNHNFTSPNGNLS